MKNLVEISATPWMQDLGWTLLHSLWQGMLCMALVVVLLRFIPSRKSSLRYAVSSLGLFLLFALAIGTFAYLGNSPLHHEASIYSVPFSNGEDEISASPTTAILNMRQLATVFVENNISLIVITWGIGALLFSLRICTGYWYINGIRKSAIFLDEHWQGQIQQLAAVLGVRKLVLLAESNFVHAPVVIGYLKPLILIPVGMFSGLTPEQVESIFIHELIHIRRNDFIVNIIQSFLEAVFFFNPFVWLLSSIIRREREHCCDDHVIMVQGNPFAYAHALASLEEARLNCHPLALSLAQNKNQLLNRIKRIMEKSADRYPGREKFAPAILLVLGLMCASWLTIAPSNQKIFDTVQMNSKSETMKGDTSKKDKSNTNGRRAVKPAAKASDQNDADNQESNIEALELTEAIPPIAPTEPLEDLDFIIPEFPEALMNLEITIPEFPEFAFDFDNHFRIDTLQPRGSSAEEWIQFSQDFEKSFKEKFGDFYEKHEDELKEMMDQVQKQVDVEFDAEHSSIKGEHFQIAQAEMAREARRLAEYAQQWQRQNQLQLQELQINARAMEDHMKMYDEKLGKELKKDGYFEDGEKINNIDISDSAIEINGKKIKESHYEKYRDLLRDLEPPAPPKLH
ncbi:MAG: M56 family metallopeptidase [Chryseolinea sp.]